jgi:hypothetical protein
MMTLARPPDEWDAETTTAAALGTLRPAVDPITGSMVKADVTRLGTVIDSRIADFCPDFKGAFQPSRVRLQNWRA